MAAVPPPMIRYCAWFGISGKNFSSSCFLAISASTGTTVSVTTRVSVSDRTGETGSETSPGFSVATIVTDSGSEATASDVSTIATDSGSEATGLDFSAIMELVSSSPFIK